MTDNEIIQALECCADDENYKCNECPLYVDCEKASIAGYALGIINRQKAEIERLKCSAIRNGKQIGSLIHHLETAKSEAYREFADKLVDAFNKDINLYGRCTVHDVALKINNTLNELTESNE